MSEPSLATFAELAGISTSYMDVFGEKHMVEDEIITQLLTALGFAPDAPDSLDRLKQWHNAPIPPTRVISENQPLQWRLPGARGAALINEAGEVLPDISVRRGMLELPALPMGYYRLTVQLTETDNECTLIVAPKKSWQPERILHGERFWGIAAQLYGLQSTYSMGMGDFSDLAELAQQSAPLGAAVIGLNPLHAGFPYNSGHISPYSPSSRLFLNSLYLDPRTIERFDEKAVPWSTPAFQEKLEAVRRRELVDYSLIRELKHGLFESLFHQFHPTAEYTAFCGAMGAALNHQALFDALCKRFGPDWRTWPEEYRSPHTQTALAFAAENAVQLDYFRWLYWQADRQCEAAQQTARDSGMEIGLYRDLAVGPDKTGAEMWSDPEAFIPGVSIGVPPDEWNPLGQNWGLPALDPFALRRRGFAPFIALLRANMRHARALRIDHAFGLSRLYLIPDGAKAGGAYLNYPFMELLAMLKIESHRNHCLVIGEDLGTFPPDYKEMAEEAGIYSYKVLYFERDANGYIPPTRYPAQALATLSTHDLPTLAAWQTGEDIDERSRLALYPTAALEQRERAARPRDKECLNKALEKEGLSKLPLFEATHRYLARSPASLVMLQLEDLLGVVPAANLPGTTVQRPNWRMKLGCDLSPIIAQLKSIAPTLDEERARPLRDVPRATYRLQFHKDFTFHDAATIVPYLAKLGVSHVYCSPYFTARPGSTHGYDITDHKALNPELGGEEGYRAFCNALKQHGLKQLLDFVPNHMGVGGSDNRLWLAALEWGARAPEASFFDIDWIPRYSGAPVKLLLPMLGNHYGDVLDAGEIEIKFDDAEGSFSAWYFTHRFPICPHDYTLIDSSIPVIEETVEAGNVLKKQLLEYHAQHAKYHAAAQCVSQDHAALHVLLERQHYRLAFWRVAASDINYRRFFDINDLAGLRVEDPHVFDESHARVLQLIAEGMVHGLRIDHIDGLADPAGYLARLRQQAGSKLYLTVEKILGAEETLPADWECDGTSGYNVLNQLTALFVEPKNAQRFDRIYRRFTGDQLPFSETTRQAKVQILETSLASEWRMLALSARRIASVDIYARDYPYETLKAALSDLIAAYPVYRAYATAAGIDRIDRERIARSVAAAKRRSILTDHSVYDFLGALLDGSCGETDTEYHNFQRRFQQVTGPVMAKGLEDTSFYRYARLLALNEVGGDPSRFGVSIAEFHRQQQNALSHGMITTATHDTKRGEDARMRLAALSEYPREWLSMLLRFSRIAAPFREEYADEVVPHPALEYFIYQTLLGSWPLELLHMPEAEELEQYRARLHGYFTKALREAKLYTRWDNPDEVYEKVVQCFVDRLLQKPFLSEFLPEVQRLAQAGALNGLVQLTLKLTLPGVPDIYQGCEYWDFSMVDPDNRRPVDYAVREQSLAIETLFSELLKDWADGRIKQHLLHKLLQHRAEFAELYRDGRYTPVAVKGARRHQVLAFARQWKLQEVLVVVPIRTALAQNSSWLLGSEFWGDTRVERNVTGSRNILTGELASSARIADLYVRYPTSILVF